jgi:hypothetical protein
MISKKAASDSIVYLILGLAGAGEVLIASYTQYASVDLNRYSILAYLQIEILIPSWWSTVGIPFIVGCAYLCASLAGLSFRPVRPRSTYFLLSCFVCAFLLAVAVGGACYFAMTVVGLDLVYFLTLQVLRREHTRS